MDIQDYDQQQQALAQLLSRLSEAEAAIKKGDEWLSLAEVKSKLGLNSV